MRSSFCDKIVGKVSDTDHDAHGVFVAEMGCAVWVRPSLSSSQQLANGVCARKRASYNKISSILNAKALYLTKIHVKCVVMCTSGSSKSSPVAWLYFASEIRCQCLRLTPTIHSCYPSQHRSLVDVKYGNQCTHITLSAYTATSCSSSSHSLPNHSTRLPSSCHSFSSSD